MKPGQLIIFLIILSAAVSCQKNAPEGFSEHPNFIILYTDDQRFDALGFSGNDAIATPNLDSICRDGVYFPQACVTTSICCPSRAALMTGRYGSANGVVSVGHVGIHPDERTLFHYLKEEQYATGVVGKWHLTNPPDSCGLDYYAYFMGNGPYYNRVFNVMGKTDTASCFIEDYNVDRSIEFIRSALEDNKPFALFHCTQLPHMDNHFDWDVREETQEMYRKRDLQPPSNWKDDLGGKPGYLEQSRSRQRALYYGYNDRDSLINHLERYYSAIT